MIRLRWPLPLVLAWALAWVVHAGCTRLGIGPVAALGLALLPTMALALTVQGLWRRLFVLAGFPMALAISGAAVLPAWAWLLPLTALLLLYPVRAWRDAPLFPTPLDALTDLPLHAPLPAGARLLDAGCGLGDGLRALRRAYPGAALHGVEWSWPLWAACALRCPWATVRREDLWKGDWSSYALVYLFQRPETMPRATAKARAELAPGAWLVSLEFEATELQAVQVLHLQDGRPLWIYQPNPFPGETTRRNMS